MELILLYDYYGALLTPRQQECFEMRYNQDLSLTEMGQELGISRQGVYDNLLRTEALLRKMEEKTGCVRRDLQCRQAAQTITAAAEALLQSSDETVVQQAKEILAAASILKE